MSDSVELVPTPSEQDEAIFSAWETGKGLRALSREFALPLREIEAALDRLLPTFDAQNQLRAFKREIRRLEDLGSECFTIARRDKSPEYMHLYARLNERVAAMRGWSPVNIRLGTDPFAVEAAQQPSGYEKIKQVLMQLKYGPDWKPSDKTNGSDQSDGAGDVLAPSDDPEPDAS